MEHGPGWLDRLVDKLATSRVFAWIAGHVLVPFWAWKTPVARRPGGPPYAIQPGDNVQRMMNLVMPLKDKTAVGRAQAALAIAGNLDEIFAGLDNVGTVHFARFVIVGNNLCMMSAYDGDFSNYIRDFIAQIGSVFDGVVALIEGGDAVIPSEDNIEAFIAWVHAHDIFQIPDIATEVLRYGPPGSPDHVPALPDDLRLLPRKLILQLNANADASLGSGYRAYPGFSVAQIRQRLELGW
ncbi:MAG: hypothetical protein ACRC1J_03665 [Sandaracinobacteroides sp.]